MKKDSLSSASALERESGLSCLRTWSLCDRIFEQVAEQILQWCGADCAMHIAAPVIEEVSAIDDDVTAREANAFVEALSFIVGDWLVNWIRCAVRDLCWVIKIH